MPYTTLRRHISPWRALILMIAAYVVIRLAIPWLVDVGVPFWIRAMFLASLPVVGVLLAPFVIIHDPGKR